MQDFFALNQLATQIYKVVLIVIYNVDQHNSSLLFLPVLDPLAFMCWLRSWQKLVSERDRFENDA